MHFLFGFVVTFAFLLWWGGYLGFSRVPRPAQETAVVGGYVARSTPLAADWWSVAVVSPDGRVSANAATIARVCDPADGLSWYTSGATAGYRYPSLRSATRGVARAYATGSAASAAPQRRTA